MHDQQAFDQVVETVATDFATNPVQYGNEDPVVPELVHRLRQRVDPEYRPVTYRQEYADESNWRVRDFHARVDETGQASRVRPEVLFVHNGVRWSYERDIKGTTKTSTPKFDLVLFDPDESLIAQSKEEGPGNYWDTDTPVSVLCEVKHSKNESSNFYAASQGVDDVQALAAYPGKVERRVFLFFDWWPIDGNRNRRYSEHRKRLVDTVGPVANPVDVIYLSRCGDHDEFTIGE